MLASDNPPNLIKQFSRALVSRFDSGMVVRVDTPDHAMRLRLVQALADRRGMTLTEAAIESVAERCRGFPNVTEVTVPGAHYIQEDSPDRIGEAIATWIGGLD